MKFTHAILHPFLDVFFPCECAGCGVTVSYSSHGICGECRRSIIPLPDPCPVCAAPLTEGACETCRGRTVYMSGTVALSTYSGAMKRIIASLKFGNHTRTVRCLSDLAVQRISHLDYRIDFITSVPMNGKKKWKRGYNQSELIAREISRTLRVPYRRMLAEKNRAGSQKTLSITERYINTIERYRVTAGGLGGMNILIVDDVYTTGSTINECSRVLLESGCTGVYALVLARVPSSLRKSAP